MNPLMIARTALRYWRMAADPRTPPLVRGLIYLGIAGTIAPRKLLPKNVPVLGLLDEKAVVPAMIALAMVLIPKRVKTDYERAEAPKSQAR